MCLRSIQFCIEDFYNFGQFSKTLHKFSHQSTILTSLRHASIVWATQLITSNDSPATVDIFAQADAAIAEQHASVSISGVGGVGGTFGEWDDTVLGLFIDAILKRCIKARISHLQ